MFTLKSAKVILCLIVGASASDELFHLNRIASVPNRALFEAPKYIPSEVFITNEGCMRNKWEYNCTFVKKAPEKLWHHSTNDKSAIVYDVDSLASSIHPFSFDGGNAMTRRSLNENDDGRIPRSGSIKVLYAFVAFSDTSPLPFTSQTVDEREATLRQLETFFYNVSGGALNVTFTLQPSILGLSKSTAHYAGLSQGLNFFEMRTDIIQALQQSDPNIMENYDMDVFEHPLMDVLWGGKGMVGTRGVLINGPANAVPSLIAHEMGHNFGFEVSFILLFFLQRPLF